MPKLDLSIIILNYNTSDWLENALRSIREFKPECAYEVIVVDNASSDDSVTMVKKKFPEVRVILSPDNGGFAKGNNLGIRQAAGKYIMLLNSDAEFTSTTKIEQIVWLMDQNKDIGVVTPRLQLPDGSLDLASHRGEPTPWAALTYFGKLEQLFPSSRLFGQYHQTWQNFDEIHQIEACSGAAMIVRTSALKNVGLLDEEFFMYAEDLDWCRRFREAGYHIYFFPRSIVIHHKYKSGRGKRDSSKQAKSNPAEHHFWHTMKQYYRKHYGHNSITTRCIELGIEVMRRLKSKR